MEGRDAPKTIIMAGVLWQDDTDIVGQATRNAQAYEAAVLSAHQVTRDLTARVQQIVLDALTTLQEALATALSVLDAQMLEGEEQARHAAAMLAQILTATDAAQVTQQELDTLNTSLEASTTRAQAALEQLTHLSEQEPQHG
jgi:hypothetical protein